MSFQNEHFSEFEDDERHDQKRRKRKQKKRKGPYHNFYEGERRQVSISPTFHDQVSISSTFFARVFCTKFLHQKSQSRT